MDTLTHALSGALLARATAPRKPTADTLPLGRRMFIGAAAAAFPDLDFITSYLSPLSYVYHHRGITHSLLLLPLWVVLLAVIFAFVWRGRPSWRAYLGITAYAVAAHIAGDLITSFGTMIFAPLSDARYALSATFIIDLWFSGIIVIALIACAVWRQRRAPAVAGMALLASYVGFQVLLQHRAVDFGEAYARSRGVEQALVTAVPRPVSPFNWTVLVADAQGFDYAHVNLIRRHTPPQPDAGTGFIRRLDAAYRPLHEAEWIHAERYGRRADETALAREAFAQPDFRFFRWFAAYPALLRIDAGNPEHCVWFHDLRFVTPGRDSTPFRYGMCRAEGDAWKPFQLVAGQKRRVY
jgi:inner membrane protein